MSTRKNTKAIFSEQIELNYTNGLYQFFCKSVAALASVVLPILRASKSVVSGSAAVALVRCIWIVHHLSLKLEGIDSISTSVHDNCFCARWRNIKDCICSHCYAYSQQARYGGLKEHNILNGIILRNVLIPVSAFKRLPLLFPYLRIESFGDVANVTQARNYIRIIKAFSGKRCAIWSKNIAIWKQAFIEEGYTGNKKPENCTFIASSPYMNKPIATTIIENFPFIDHIFTVYEKKYAIDNNISINCGGRKCMECIMKKTNCYYSGGPLYINELKK